MTNEAFEKWYKKAWPDIKSETFKGWMWECWSSAEFALNTQLGDKGNEAEKDRDKTTSISSEVKD